MLTQALAAVAPGGFLFVGDVRSLPLLKLFHTSVQIFTAAPDLPLDRLRERIRRAVETEQELLVDPEFFRAFARTRPEVGEVEIQLRRGRWGNELNRFRYDVILHRGRAAGTPVEPTLLLWDECPSLAAIRACLAASEAPALQLRSIPNRRLAGEVMAATLAESAPAATTVGALREELQRATADGIDPEDLWELADETGFTARIEWNASSSCSRLDALFLRPGTTVRETSVAAPSRPLDAYVNPPPREQLTAWLSVELREHLAGLLPAYMVPSAWVVLAELPLTPNGKVDRRALPSPTAEPTARGRFVAPATPIEAALAAIWEQVLGVARISAHDDFFALGGHSLLGTQVIARVRETFAVELPLRRLFDRPTLTTLAAEIATEKSLGRELSMPPIVPAPRDGSPVLSFGQERLWFLDRLQPGNPFYNVAGALRLWGPLDMGAVGSAIGRIVRRHEVLASNFFDLDGEPRMRVDLDRTPALAESDLSALPAARAETEERRRIHAEAFRPFELACDPLLRLLVLRRSPAEHVVVFTLHHIVSDAWSLGILMREFAAFYSSCESTEFPPPALPVQYADFAAWQRRWLRGETLETQLAYWRNQLAGAPPRLGCPPTGRAPRCQPSWEPRYPSGCRGSSSRG